MAQNRGPARTRSQPSPPAVVLLLFTSLVLAVAAIAHAAPASRRPARGPADGDWPMAAHDYANTRYSPLDQVNGRNVARLELAWSFTTGVEKGHEAAPIVVGSTMYVVTPYPNVVFALDLAKAGRPDMVKWRYQPKVLPAAQGVACCDVVNRGACYAGGRVFFNTLDGQTIALDAASGRELWVARVGDIQLGETVTMAALVV
jgi:glucose dehydrogenase